MLYLVLAQVNFNSVIPTLCSTAIYLPRIIVESTQAIKYLFGKKPDAIETFSLGAIHVTGTNFDVEVSRMSNVPGQR
jgi:hypothetical protein